MNEKLSECCSAPMSMINTNARCSKCGEDCVEHSGYVFQMISNPGSNWLADTLADTIERYERDIAETARQMFIAERNYHSIKYEPKK